jgi:hypothetical protein
MFSFVSPLTKIEIQALTIDDENSKEFALHL